MYRLFVFSAVLPILAGCASSVPEPDLQTRNDLAETAPAAPAAATASALPDATPVVVDVEDFKYRTVCKDVVRTGTRIVVDKYCYSIGDNDTRQESTVAVEALRAIQVSKTWDRPEFRADKAVT